MPHFIMFEYRIVREVMSKPNLEMINSRPDDATLLADEAKYCSFGDTSTLC